MRTNDTLIPNLPHGILTRGAIATRLLLTGTMPGGSGVIEELVTRVVARIRQSSVYVPQKGSPLGRNRHINAVRRRIADGEEGAFRCGKTYLLTPEALREEMRGLGDAPVVAREPKPPVKAGPDSNPFAEVDAEIARVLEACR
jgi:hypothetical protein